MGGNIRLHRSRRGPLTRAAAISVLSALVLTWAGPASADDAPPGDPADGGTQAPIIAAGPEQTAQQQAESTGTPVPVDALTTQTDQVVAQPDGTFTRISYVQPVRINEGGAWTAVDATLTAVTGGGYSPAATPSHVLLSGGGSGPLATLTDPDGNQLSYTFPVPLPAPTVTGSTALYADVLPGVDLQARVTDQGGFGEVLIVHDTTAAANPVLHDLHLATTTQGLTLTSDAAGNIAARTSDGTAAFTSPTPLMWDSSTNAAAGGTQAARAAASAADTPEDVSSASGPGQGARVAEVGVSTATGALTLSPDQELLEGSETTYPVYIDPYTSPGTLTVGDDFVEVAEGCPGAKLRGIPQDQGEGIGYQHYSQECYGMERSYYSVSTSGLTTAMKFDSATLHLTETYGSDHGCSNTWPLTVKATDAIGDSTDWDHQPTVKSTVKSSIPVKSAATGCGDQTVNVDVTSQIAAAAGHQASWTFGLFGDETRSDTNYGHMRFSENPYITTVYDIPPPAPTSPSTTPDSVNPAGAACGTGPVGWIGRTTYSTVSSNITLNATLTSPMTGANLRGQYSVWDYSSGSALTHPGDSPSVASGGTAHTNIGLTVKDGHQYGWNVLAYDGHQRGLTTQTCHFNVDLQPPTPAHIDDSTAFPPLGSTAAPTAHAGDTGLTVHISSTDVAPTGCTPSACVKSGIRRFEYSMDSAIPPSGASAVTVTPDASGTASADIPVSVSAQQWGTHTLYVRAVDGADNSSTVTYSFYAPWNPDNAVAPGDLDGDGVPDTITPAPDGSLQLLSGDAGVSATPQTSSPTDKAPDCATDALDCHPAHPGWSNFLVTHRGSYVQSGVDDLLAYSRNTNMLYLYINDANGLEGDARTTAAGHFTKGKIIRMSLKPPCSGTGDCSGYDTTWDSVQQLIAAGDATDSDGPPSLVTVENGHLWFYSGSRNAAAHLSAAKLLGTGDWSSTTLIAPGAVNGKLTLWVRDNATGLVSTYPIPLGGDGLPTTALTPPAAHPLISSATTSDGTSLCVDLRQGVASNGTPIQAYTCNATPAQNWTLGADGSVRSAAHCLDVTGGATAAGSPVQLYTCNATAAQQWQPNADGTLRNPVSGRCLTIPTDQTAQGTQLVLGDCTAAPGQRWTTNAAGTAPVQEPLLPLNLTTASYPSLSSPGDANTPGSTTPAARDGLPDLYVTDAHGQVIEYPGAPADGDTARFATPVSLGYLAGSKPPTAGGDLDGDGRPDIAAIDADGHLRVYAGQSTGSVDLVTRSIGGGWTGADISHHGDYNGDGYEDLIVHMPNAPGLRLYPGDGAAGNAEHGYTTIPRPAGSPSPDWSATAQVIAAGDITFDALPDLLAVEKDALYLFPGTSDGNVGTPTMIGTNHWSDTDLMIPGDVNGDGLDDLWSRNRTTGLVRQYLNDTAHPATVLGIGSRAMTLGIGLTATANPGIAAPGDATGDGHPDLWTTWTSDNHLHFYPGNGKAGTGSQNYGLAAQADVSGTGWTTTIQSMS